MRPFVFMFLTSLMLYVTAAPSSHRLSSSSPHSRLSSRDRQLLRNVLCILQGRATDDCIQDGNTSDIKKRRLDSQNMEEEAMQMPGLTPFHGMPERREAFYSDWRRRK